MFLKRRLMKNDNFEYSRNLEKHNKQLDAELLYKNEIDLIKRVRIDQQEKPVIDSRGNRWCKCEFCGKVSTLKDFSSYGGPGHVNSGTCYDCNYLSVEQINKKLQNIGSSGKLSGNACPLCGGKVVKKTGRYGAFWGCSRYPDCTFTDTIV